MSTKRIRRADTVLASWDDVDQCLAEIGKIDREIGLLEAAQQEQIDALKAATKAAAEPHQVKKTGLELAIQQYCEAHRAEFANAKTRKLNFGSVGFRLSTSVVIKRIADTLAALKALGLTHCIRVKEELDKDAMRNLPTETLAEVGAGLKTVDAFGYEIDREQLAEAA